MTSNDSERTASLQRLSGKLPYYIAFFATIIRYYDYALFGLSASVLAANFMPSGSSSDRLLNFFMIFSFSVVARPVGAIIFGRIADRIGRAASVKITTIVAALSTAMIALLPNYKTVGFFATIAVILCRMLFLMSLAGEADAIKIYVAEKIGKKYRNLSSGFISFLAQIGALIAACMYNFTISFEQLSWLWRINFIIGGILGLLAFYLRNHLQESQYYLDNKAKYAEQFLDFSLIKLVAKNKRKFFLAMVISGGSGASYNFLVIFLSTFVANVIGSMSQSEAAMHNILLIILYAICCLISGSLADRAAAIYKQSIVSLVSCLVVIFMLQLAGAYNLFIFPLHLLTVIFVPLYTIPLQVKLQSMFPVSIRVRMCSLAHSLGSMIFSATVPFLSMLIWKYTENFSVVYIYFALLLVMMIFASFMIMHDAYENMFEDNSK